MDHESNIEGVFNYCNRRCERCPFTMRCRLFEDMQEYERQHPDRGPMEQAHDNLQETFRLLGEWCEREGIDFEAIQREAVEERAEAELLRQDDEVEADPLHKMASMYTMAAIRLVDGLSAARALRKWPADVCDAIDCISWYSGMVGAKIHRALHGLVASRDEDWCEIDAVQNDWNGSAKVARIIVAESSAAWRVVMDTGQAPADSPLTELVALLDRIDQGLAERFPRAMEFRRPGFDDPVLLVTQSNGRVES